MSTAIPYSRPFFSSDPAPLTPDMVKRLSAGIAAILDRRNNLESWLAYNGTTDDDFAISCGLTRGYISRLRRNMVNPSIETVIAVWEATGKQIPWQSLRPSNRKPTGAKRRVRS